MSLKNSVKTVVLGLIGITVSSVAYAGAGAVPQFSDSHPASAGGEAASTGQAAESAHASPPSGGALSSANQRQWLRIPLVARIGEFLGPKAICSGSQAARSVARNTPGYRREMTQLLAWAHATPVVSDATAFYSGKNDAQSNRRRELQQSIRKHQLLVQDIEETMARYGGFINLPSDGQPGRQIAASAPSQELWVKIMGSNPSRFSHRRYCPDTYREVAIRSTRQIVGMCPDFPVDSVQAQSRGNGNSDEEFLARLNLIYRNAGSLVRFRRQTYEEFDYADTADGREPKISGQPDLGIYLPHYEVSHLSRMGERLPSGEHQSRSILDNRPNSIGFRRSGVWEWTSDMSDLAGARARGLVGGSWDSEARFADSGRRNAIHPSAGRYDVGPARLVRIEP